MGELEDSLTSFSSEQRFCCGPAAARYCCSLAQKQSEDPLFDAAAMDTADEHDIVFRYGVSQTHYWHLFLLLTFGVFCTFIILYFFGTVILGVRPRTQFDKY